MKCGSYFRIGVPQGNQLDDVPFPLGEWFSWAWHGLRSRLGLGRGLERRGDVTQQPDGDRRGDQRIADRGGAHGFGQQRWAAVLEQEATGTATQRGVDVL